MLRRAASPPAAEEDWEIRPFPVTIANFQGLT
jgi:hypothetical protein